MRNPVSEKRLRDENEVHGGSGGCSQGNRHHGFRPAFLDFATQRVYDSCFADGRPAPFHLLDGLPDEVVLERSVMGRVLSAKSTLISGFVRHGFFYTRTAAARAIAEWPRAPVC
jgi:hypothetical protein